MTPPRRALLLTVAAALPWLAAALWVGAAAGPPADVPGAPGSDGVREIRLRAHAWGFRPRVLRVQPGETVRFRVASDDVKHGLTIAELDLNLLLAPNQEVRSPARRITLAEGVYAIQCSAFCGLGHAAMKGVLIVGAPPRHAARAPWIASLAALATVVVIVAAARRVGGSRRGA